MAAHPALFAVNIIISIVAILLIIIYSTIRIFRSFPYYFNIIFTLTITFDNIIRLIPGGKGTGIDVEGEEKTISCKIQAFTLTMFDKLMLTLMTSYSIIAYLGSCQLNFYRKNEKIIFIILTVISIIISLITTIIFYQQGISNRSEYCYVETKNTVKQIIDTIVTSFLLAFSLFCIIKVLIKICYLKKEKENDTPTAKKAINNHFCRFIFDFFVNSITFTYVILLINKAIKIENFVKDLLYVLFSLMVELFFTINLKLILEVKRIITCQNENEVEIEEEDPQQEPNENMTITDNLNQEDNEDEDGQ